jgi:ankyrin repeat protein
LAVAKGDVKVTQALIDAGVSTNVTDNDGVTPAMDAQKRGYRAILELLDKASIK